MTLKKTRFPKIYIFIHKPKRAGWAYHIGICLIPRYKQEKGDVLYPVSYVSPIYNLPGYVLADMMEPIRHNPGDWIGERLGVHTAWLSELDRMWGLRLALVFLIWVFPSSAATTALGAPITSCLTKALFLSCSLKGVENPSLPLVKALLRDFREKNSGAFHEENQKNLAACYIGLKGTRPDSKTGLVGAGWGNEARNGEGINESLCLVY